VSNWLNAVPVVAWWPATRVSEVAIPAVLEVFFSLFLLL
jgi:hypothetical protein